VKKLPIARNVTEYKEKKLKHESLPLQTKAELLFKRLTEKSTLAAN
jgi:hypothetical protein